MTEPQFGGPWTEEKLSRLRKYLQAYMTIFSTNTRAKLLKTTYVDAFAGTAFRKEFPSQAPEEDSLFDVSSDSDAEALRKGSTQVALETIPPFSEYIFIEHNEEHARSLLNLTRRFPNVAPRIKIIPEDANVYLLKWCKETDWKRTRAVVFLDPYGMQVDWATIETMACTKAIDPWILFPLGLGVNRLLLKDRARGVRTVTPTGWRADYMLWGRRDTGTTLMSLCIQICLNSLCDGARRVKFSSTR